MPNPNHNPDEFWIAIGDKQAIQRDKELRALIEQIDGSVPVKTLTAQMESEKMKLEQAKEIIQLAIWNNPNVAYLSRAIKTVLDALAAAGSLPKIVIDHLKYGTGVAPFDGNGYLLHDRCGGIVSGSYMIDHDIGDDHIWRDDAGFTYKAGTFTHYTPKPEFFEVRTLETKA